MLWDSCNCAVLLSDSLLKSVVGVGVISCIGTRPQTTELADNSMAMLCV